MQYLAIILIIVNIGAFFLYGYDKNRAIKHQYRVPEKTLLSLAIIAPFGCYLGMRIWHHKTKKWYFQVVNIGLSIIHIGGMYYLYFIM